MSYTANIPVTEQGKFRRGLVAVFAYLQSLEATNFDYTLDRIESLERDVGRLKEEVRQSRDLQTVHAHNDSSAASGY